MSSITNRALIFLSLAMLIGGLIFWFYGDSLQSNAKLSAIPQHAISAKLPAPSYVGRAVCAACHVDQDKLWQGSHHDLAMQDVNENTVLGDFNDAEFTKDGVVSRFFRQNGRYVVRTDGEDGKQADFEIKYTFGVVPLQQYLIELSGGRLQALSIAWDNRPKAQGGQHWFHLYPNEKIDHTDELHWTKRSQNWNFMCAECHSTQLQKNYDAATRTYHTTWAEIDVACEACHGPGSQHVTWAQKPRGFEGKDAQSKGLQVLLNERRGVQWSIDPQSGNGLRNMPRSSDTEIEVCARCHSRRAQLFGDYQHGQLLDSHLPALLSENLYHADGQIDGEVYEYGSFLQSKMFKAGVTCSDCHEPHSLKLRSPDNGVCLQCHSADKYGSAQHHFHKNGSAGSVCVDCHMPSKTYMVVDPRRDHSFRVPRPDLSEKIGTPNACNGCHTDKPAQWAAETVRQWLGRDAKGYQNFAEVLHAQRSNHPTANMLATSLMQDNTQPSIARATAAAELARGGLNPETLPTLSSTLNDPNPLVRVAALEAIEQLPIEQRWPLVQSLLSDPVRSVRALAAATLAGVTNEPLPAEGQADLNRATADYLKSLQWNADDPATQVNRGNFYVADNQAASAEQAYREALAIDPNWLPAYVNLADFLRLNNRDGEGEVVLKQGLSHLPNAADLYHSLGLLQVRQKNINQALLSLARAVELEPKQARFNYVYAVALVSVGRIEVARSVVKAALNWAPNDADLNALNLQFTTKD